MERTYLTPTIELCPLSSEDIISTSVTIELPWLPLVEDEKEI